MPSAKTATIHAVIGTDDVEVKRVAKELSVKLGPGGEFGTDIIDGQADNADGAAQRVYQAIEALNTFGFFGGGKLVWLKNANFLGDDRTGNAQSTLDALEKLTELLKKGLPDGTAFLLSAGSVDKRRSFYKTLGKVAEVQVFEKLDNSKAGWEDEAAPMVRDLADRRELRFDEEALEIFTVFTGGDRRTIESELDKMDLYLGKARRDVTVEDVRLLTPVSRAGVIFELGNAIAARQLQRSLELFKQLLFQGEKEVTIILVAIIPTVRNLLLVKDLMQRHKLTKPAQPFFFGKQLERLAPEAIAHLPRTKEGKLNAYQLGIAAAHAHRYELEELQSALKACLEANVALVSAPTDPQVVISQLLVRIVAK
jgi:DNA polymerase III subunit delta